VFPDTPGAIAYARALISSWGSARGTRQPPCGGVSARTGRIRVGTCTGNASAAVRRR